MSEMFESKTTGELKEEEDDEVEERKVSQPGEIFDLKTTGELSLNR